MKAALVFLLKWIFGPVFWLFIAVSNTHAAILALTNAPDAQSHSPWFAAFVIVSAVVSLMFARQAWNSLYAVNDKL